MNIRKDLVKSLDLIFKSNDFIKKTNNWYYFGELILRINLQKSYYGEIFYINLDIYFNNGEENYFPLNMGDITTRLEHFISDSQIDKELNFESLSEEEITKKIKHITTIVNSNMQTFKNITNIKNIKNYLTNNSNYLVSKDFMEKIMQY